MSLAGIIFVLLLTYYLTKWIAVKGSNISKSKYIHIIDRIMLGQNKYLAIIEISNKYYLMSITDQNINIIKELNELELKITENVSEMSLNSEFNKIFSKFKR